MNRWVDVIIINLTIIIMTQLYQSIISRKRTRRMSLVKMILTQSEWSFVEMWRRLVFCDVVLIKVQHP